MGASKKTRNEGEFMKIVDFNQIDSLLILESETDEPIVTELLDIYKVQFQNLMNDLELAYTNQDLYKMSNLAHKLKSSSYNLGFSAVGDLCLKIETEGRKKTALDYRSIFSEMKSLYFESLQLIDDKLLKAQLKAS